MKLCAGADASDVTVTTSDTGTGGWSVAALVEAFTPLLNFFCFCSPASDERKETDWGISAKREVVFCLCGFGLKSSLDRSSSLRLPSTKMLTSLCVLWWTQSLLAMRQGRVLGVIRISMMLFM